MKPHERIAHYTVSAMCFALACLVLSMATSDPTDGFSLVIFGALFLGGLGAFLKATFSEAS